MSEAWPLARPAIRLQPRTGDGVATGGPVTWSRLGDLNPGPTHYECVALPLS